MTPEQENQLARTIQATQSEEAINELVMANMREALLYLHTVAHGHRSERELVSITYAALVMNAKRFRPGMQRFFVFSKQGLRGALSRSFSTLKTVRGAKSVYYDCEEENTQARLTPRQRADSMDNEEEKIGTLHRKTCTFESMDRPEMLVNPELATDPDYASIFLKDRWAFVSKIIKQRCSPRECLVLELKYRQGFLQREIASLLGISITAVQAAHSRALMKIRRRIAVRTRIFNEEML